MRDHGYRNQTEINFAIDQHSGNPGRVVTDQLNLSGDRRLFQSVNERPGIQVINNACANLLQLGYFCAAKVKDILIYKQLTWN